jgi:hypothetical protein
MASGFITLPTGGDWSARWSTYDGVLENIMTQLSFDGDEGALKNWLTYILPNEDKGDTESGYCFYKYAENPEDSESILRIIDTRLMKEKYQLIFWNTVKELCQKFSWESDAGFYIHELYEAYQYSLKLSKKEPEDLDLKEIFSLGGFDIGK